ncbi:MAG: sulfur carrier protein ThiS [Burkholderia sp.]|nr:sulfur carrier protein ThiS [Burkholderia sp.]
MDIWINKQILTLPDSATVADALAEFDTHKPFAVSLNGIFIARTQYKTHILEAGDTIELIYPVAGG